MTFGEPLEPGPLSRSRYRRGFARRKQETRLAAGGYGLVRDRAAGTRDRRARRLGYVLMSRLPGVALATVWNGLAARERDVLATRLGETLATLHQLPPPQIPDWSPRARAPGGCGACPGRPSPR